jgi:phage terminase large subunit
LSVLVDKVISNFARYKAYEYENYRITFGGQLLPYLEGLIADNLFLPPRPAINFSNILVKENILPER